MVLVGIFATTATAEELFGAALPGMPSVAGALYGDGPLGWAISSDARVGYGHIGVNFNVPRPDVGLDLDLSFKGANVWIGSVGVRADSCSGFFLALRGQGAASRNIRIRTPAEPTGAVRWDGPKLQWWALDGHIGYRVRPNCAALVGLRRDQLSVGLTNPRDETGQPINHSSSGPGDRYESVRVFGDFSSKVWIPYLGLEITGPQVQGFLAVESICTGRHKRP